MFLRQGFYGLADGAAGARRLAEQLDRLLSDPPLRAALGHFGRHVVTERFSLQRAVRLQLEIYEHVRNNPPPRHMPDALRSAGRALMLEIRNHDPRRKRACRARERDLLAAAREGQWPPHRQLVYADRP
jgi:hypothetical protein